VVPKKAESAELDELKTANDQPCCSYPSGAACREVFMLPIDIRLLSTKLQTRSAERAVWIDMIDWRTWQTLWLQIKDLQILV
jgi:hypothetical protein